MKISLSDDLHGYTVDDDNQPSTLTVIVPMPPGADIYIAAHYHALVARAIANLHAITAEADTLLPAPRRDTGI